MCTIPFAELPGSAHSATISRQKCVQTECAGLPRNQWVEKFSLPSRWPLSVCSFPAATFPGLLCGCTRICRACVDVLELAVCVIKGTLAFLKAHHSSSYTNQSSKRYNFSTYGEIPYLFEVRAECPQCPQHPDSNLLQVLFISMEVTNFVKYALFFLARLHSL